MRKLIDRKRLIPALTAVLIALCAAVPAHANQWFNGVTVTRVSGYQYAGTHFVWLSSGAGSECQAANSSNPVFNFNENSSNGKSLLTLLMTALVAQRSVNVQVSGCDVVEMY